MIGRNTADSLSRISPITGNAPSNSNGNNIPGNMPHKEMTDQMKKELEALESCKEIQEGKKLYYQPDSDDFKTNILPAACAMTQAKKSLASSAM